MKKLFDDIQRFTYTDSSFTRLRGAGEELLRYRMLLRQAKRYVVDNELLEYAVRLSLEPKHVAMAFRTCRAPFDCTYIEVDHHHQMRLLHKYSFLQHGLILDEVPMKMGYFIVKGKEAHQWSVYEFAGGVSLDDNEVFPTPVVYHFDLEGTPDQPFTVPKPVPLKDGAQYICLGYADGNKSKDDVIVPYWAHGKIAASIEPITMLHAKQKDQDKVAENIWFCMKEFRGQMRVLITTLSLMTQLPVESREVYGTHSHVYGGRRVKDLDHTYLYIEVPKKRKFEWVRSEHTRAYKKMRRHNVSGYYRKGKWVSDYWRGDETLGFVNKTRKLTLGATLARS